MDQKPFNTQPPPPQLQQSVAAARFAPSVQSSSLASGIVHVSQQPPQHVLQSPGKVTTPGGGSYPVTTTPNQTSAVVKNETIIKTEPGLAPLADTTELAGTTALPSLWNFMSKCSYINLDLVLLHLNRT